jgi:alkanesulfonate monooxygenase SsuD/methylene tetrahydromethanopterin reductase-like flavin-dependent oxidoreductase (luciferase family)
MDGGNPRWADVAAMTRMAEDVGFESGWLEDHLIFRFPERPQEGPWESFSLVAGLAAITERIELGTLVTCTSFRNPALTAKIADTIDEISNGRFILGLGAGWHEPEYLAFGLPFDHRVSRFEEALQIIHGLLKHGNIDFDGAYYSARECELRPRGPRASGPPLLIGTTGARMLRLTAEYADSWNAFANTTAVAQAKFALVDAACEAVGRDHGTLERTITVEACIPGRVPKTDQPDSDQTDPPLHGSVDDIAAAISAFGPAGVHHLQEIVEPNTLAGIEAFGPVLEAVARNR